MNYKSGLGLLQSEESSNKNIEENNTTLNFNFALNVTKRFGQFEWLSSMVNDHWSPSPTYDDTVKAMISAYAIPFWEIASGLPNLKSY